jgi:hypothetical protein
VVSCADERSEPDGLIIGEKDGAAFSARYPLRWDPGWGTRELILDPSTTQTGYTSARMEKAAGATARAAASRSCGLRRRGPLGDVLDEHLHVPTTAASTPTSPDENVYFAITFWLSFVFGTSCPLAVSLDSCRQSAIVWKSRPPTGTATISHMEHRCMTRRRHSTAS